MSAPAPSAPPVILIAEDERPIAEALEQIVHELGYTPLVARNGREALDLAQQHWPALLITDLMMPYVNGAELIAALRARADADARAMMPVIVLTAVGAGRARTIGADAVLGKPFDLDELEALIRHLLDSANG